jgi:hypothetical protein
MPNPSRGPRALSEILGELFTVRGYSRLQARQELEDAWNAVLGEPTCYQTQLGEVRRGVLNVTVAHSTLLEELAAFRKPALLAALRSNAPATPIHDIRFRVGMIGLGVQHPTGIASPPSTLTGEFKPARSHRAVLKERTQAGNGSKLGRGPSHDPAQP